MVARWLETQFASAMEAFGHLGDITLQIKSRSTENGVGTQNIEQYAAMKSSLLNICSTLRLVPCGTTHSGKRNVKWSPTIMIVMWTYICLQQELHGCHHLDR